MPFDFRVSYNTSTYFSNCKKTAFDHERYNHDKELYGEAVAEMWKNNGSYNKIL